MTDKSTCLMDVANVRFKRGPGCGRNGEARRKHAESDKVAR